MTDAKETPDDTQSTDSIVLIGMPGSGKSTLGVVLARILNYDFIDTDIIIQQQKNRTLERIIDALGPEGFIEVENQILCNLELEHAILATGGSAVYSDEAMCHLRTMGRIVFLRVGYEELRKRMQGLPERGVVMRDGPDMSMHDVYDERQALYERYADIVVDTDGLSTPESARKVADALNE